MRNHNPHLDHHGFRHEHEHGWRNDWKAGRGDIQPLILDVLQEKPMHGYEIIRKLEDRSHGMWRPSPGSIYPTLQMLVDQGLVESADEAGKKTYSLTDDGRKSAKASGPQAPWDRGNLTPQRMLQMRMTGMHLMKTMKQILKNGSDEQFDQARKIIDETIEKLHAVLDEKPKTPHKDK